MRHSRLTISPIAVSPSISPPTPDCSASSRSIRAENNRCACKWFICTMYYNTFSVVPADPSHLSLSPSPFAKVGIVFETGLAGQRKKRGFCPGFTASLTTRYVVLSSLLSQAHIVLEASSRFLIQNVKIISTMYALSLSSRNKNAYNLTFRPFPMNVVKSCSVLVYTHL